MSIILTGIGKPPTTSRSDHDDSSGCVFPIDIYSRICRPFGFLGLPEQVNVTFGNFVYLPKISLQPYFSSNGEFSYFGDFSLFRSSTLPSGIALTRHSGFIRVLNERGKYYTVVASDNGIDYVNFLCRRALAKDKGEPFVKETKALLVSARRDFSVEPLPVSSLEKSMKYPLNLEQIMAASREELLEMAKSRDRPHPEEEKIMNTYKSRVFEPMIEPVRTSPLDAVAKYLVHDIPVSLENLDFLCNLNFVDRQ